MKRAIDASGSGLAPAQEPATGEHLRPSREPAGRAARSPETTRARLLAAARAAFADHGFEGASTHRIAAAAGVPQGLVRHHFGGKAGLFVAVLELGAAELSQALASASELGAALARHEQVLRVLLHALLEGPERARLVDLHCSALLDRLGLSDASAERIRWLGGELALALLKARREALPRELPCDHPAQAGTSEHEPITSSYWPKPERGAGAWAIARASARRAR